MKNIPISIFAFVYCALCFSCSLVQAAKASRDEVSNPAAYIPPQCYTKTKDASGRVHNPCFTCHSDSPRPNMVNDSDLQLAYLFPDLARKNHWVNLFKDRRAEVAAISDTEIDRYISQSNYLAKNGDIVPAKTLRENAGAWDFNGDGKWGGFIPDAYFKFDKQGFDHRPDGTYSGWRSYAYYPLPGTFWPTNGSTDDVMIRLPAEFRQDETGRDNIQVYIVNLAIVEALIRKRTIAIDTIDEHEIGSVDIDKNGSIGPADRVVYDWAPLQQRQMSYVGRAALRQREGKVHLAAGLFPEGTEFMHSVRYISLDAKGNNHLSPRMKELRYARKTHWMSYADLERENHAEIKEAHDFPERLRVIHGNIEAGVSNGQGWVYAGMIENAKGQLRPQSYEELSFCVGCHGGAGQSRDGVVSFHRKLDDDSFQHAWFHWSQKDLRGVKERRRPDGAGEYSYYLEQNGAGDEFRRNTELETKFFDQNGVLKSAALARMQRDIAYLLYASPARARELNKAYKLIVQEQSFVDGRDATVTAADNVYVDTEGEVATGILSPLTAW